MLCDVSGGRDVAKRNVQSPRGEVTTKSLLKQNCTNRARPVQTAHKS